ncbi:MAG: copper amine oxidase N-terminal domain-containing protein [Firmicutes bacterium]|nr:copper amine oxidase N-terminal domain-containing protein [Bacillota bacterium]
MLEIARDLSPVGLLRMDLPPGGGFRVPVSLVAGEGVYRLTLRDGSQKMVVSTEVRVGAYRDQSPGSPVRLAALEAALARGRGLDVPGAAWLGRAWASLGRFERAARILARTAASGPEDKAVREVLGEVRNRLDELKRPGVQWVLNGKIVGTAHLSKGRAYVPLEDLAQAAGFSTFSFPGGRHTARFGPKLISFEGGSRRVYLNGAGRDWTVPPLDSGGKLMVPVRDLVSLAGGEVFWDPATGSVLITLPGPGLD